MSRRYSQFDDVLALAGRIVDSNVKCRNFIAEKQKKLGNEYSLHLETVLLKPAGREVDLRVLFPGSREGCEIVLDVDLELVRSVKNYLG